MRNDDLLRKEVKRLIEDGNQVLATEFDASVPRVHYLVQPRGVNLQAFTKFQAGFANLLRLLGTYAEPWKVHLVERKNTPENVKRLLGTLEAIADTVESGLLVNVEDLVRAEAFDSLLSQADYLMSETYFLAAGVLGRAVLEEHLRKWCDFTSCGPTKFKPTINDFKDSLYKNKRINVSQMKQIESLAAIGNDAAHNNPSLSAGDVQRLLRDVRDILLKHPLSSP